MISALHLGELSCVTRYRIYINLMLIPTLYLLNLLYLHNNIDLNYHPKQYKLLLKTL